MIASIASWFLTSKLGRGIALAGGVLLAIVTFGAMKKKQGHTEAETDALKDGVEREERGRDAVAKEQAETTGLSNSDIIERMRRRDR